MYEKLDNKTKWHFTGPRPLIRHLSLKGRVLQPLERVTCILPELDALDSLEAMVDCKYDRNILKYNDILCVLFERYYIQSMNGH